MSATDATAPPLLRATGITKRYPGVRALDGVALELRNGEAVGLVGENGSGKSTLLKILAGRIAPDEGTIEIDGAPVRWSSPARALDSGIALIAQEVHVQDELSVAENLLGQQLPRRRFGAIDWSAAARSARELLDSIGLAHVSPTLRTGRLSLHDQQMLSIAKVVRLRPRVALFDEPTSSLTAAEIERLYAMIAQLRAGGTAIVYITHRLQEYFDLTDRVVVLRDGQLVAESATTEIDENGLVERMVGRRLVRLFERPAEKDAERPPRPTALRVRGLTTRTLRGIDLEVAAGEIVGIAGQAGCGRSSLAGTLFGQWPYDGEIAVDGAPVALGSAARAVRAGIALVPEDRKRQGLVLSMSIAENLAMPSWRDVARGGVRRPAAETAWAEGLRERFGIRAVSVATVAGALSGGNQQKIVIAKWAARGLRVLVLDEPTRGVDVGAKAEIYRIVESLAAEGVAVLVISSELHEVMRLADRVVVMAHGELVGEMRGRDATEEAITAMAFAAGKESEV
ncbi:sugar ABC transporter ATP-binding protein [Conexibacter stalactiti]|uniref:Sugar ABC transporter ATP-binding protein n=1 Tax=Conexibacter stalactiti TaxID=1940611 RepID=A0ABU4HV53_9ACTN|nr:sugar ABC transporter ATP-binding protein [Conexibacter stalactiti]MDW5597069.1 sugar ABC transporter ATP-binding protein [Conexibacter stalactiti]MEC5037711.1 sugar ABC transporter ATP-binding protein [Conexibacter stalactiti]